MKRTNKQQMLFEYFSDELQYLYWTEKVINTSLPDIIEAIDAPIIRDILSDIFMESSWKISRFDNIMEIIGEKDRHLQCEISKSLIEKLQDEIDSDEQGETRDAMILTGMMKIQKFQISSYESLQQLAMLLSEWEVMSILEESQEELKSTYSNLSDSFAVLNFDE